VKCKITAMTSQSITYSETGGKVTTAKARTSRTSRSAIRRQPGEGRGGAGQQPVRQGDLELHAALEEITKEKKRDLHKWYILFTSPTR
jgi:hypothetical protein